MASIVVVTGPADEPITLESAKLHLRVTHSTEDDEITRMIAGARDAIERWCRTKIITQTVRLRLDAFPNGHIRLPYGKTASITSLTYVDTAGTTQTLTGYQSDLDCVPARLAPAYLATWPSTREVLGAVNVTYVVGAAEAEPSIVAAMKLLVGDLYASRESVIVGTIVENNPTVQALLNPHRLDVLALELEQ